MVGINLNFNGDSKDSEREGENILEIADSENLGDISRQHKEVELDLLIQRLDEDRIGHVQPTIDRIRGLAKKLESNKQFPYTLGIFGGWGSGKTFILSSLAKVLRKEEQKVIYFNAFTYASFADLTTSLVYRILRSANPDSGMLKLLHQVNAISRTHAKGFYKRAVLPAKILRASREFYSNVESDRQLKIAANYFGKVDKIHQALARSFKNHGNAPVYVLIDELDRCDPEEAFGVIKQLRVLLNAPELPLFFVLSINPDPIGKYLQKKYGLDEHDSYESISILEKFVDASIHLPPNRDIGKFIEHRLFQLQLNPEKFYPTVLKLQSRKGKVPFLPPGIGSLPIFANLRMISKTLESLASNNNSKNLYSHWIWDLLQVSSPNLALTATRLAAELQEITDLTVGDLVIQLTLPTGLYASDYADVSSNFFDLYCRLFKGRLTDMAHKRIKNEQSEAGAGKLLLEMASSANSVYSLAHLCCVDIGDIRLENLEAKGNDIKYSSMVPASRPAFVQLKTMLLPSAKQ